MSRVDDDRDAQRVAERLMLQKKQAEGRAQAKNSSDSVFSKLVEQTGSEQASTQQRSAAQRALQQALAQAGDEQLAEKSDSGGREAQARSGANKSSGAFTERIKRDAQSQLGKKDESVRDDMAAEGHVESESGYESGIEIHQRDSKSTDQGDDERGQNARNSASARARHEGDLKADGDSGSGGQSGGNEKKDQGGSGDLSSSFRLNPALMAPVGIAQPKDAGGSAKLRALANEIAQKIVERVRLGTNALGKAEFQIDLRSNVLSGLSIKVSGGNGKIKAVFSGNDREVLRMLREQADGLKTALQGRGLTLEEFRVEERA